MKPTQPARGKHLSRHGLTTRRVTHLADSFRFCRRTRMESVSCSDWQIAIRMPLQKWCQWISPGCKQRMAPSNFTRNQAIDSAHIIPRTWLHFVWAYHDLSDVRTNMANGVNGLTVAEPQARCWQWQDYGFIRTGIEFWLVDERAILRYVSPCYLPSHEPCQDFWKWIFAAFPVPGLTMRTSCRTSSKSLSGVLVSR